MSNSRGKPSQLTKKEARQAAEVKSEENLRRHAAEDAWAAAAQYWCWNGLQLNAFRHRRRS